MHSQMHDVGCRRFWMHVFFVYNENCRQHVILPSDASCCTSGEQTKQRQAIASNQHRCTSFRTVGAQWETHTTDRDLHGTLVILPRKSHRLDAAHSNMGRSSSPTRRRRSSPSRSRSASPPRHRGGSARDDKPRSRDDRRSSPPRDRAAAPRDTSTKKRGRDSRSRSRSPRRRRSASASPSSPVDHKDKRRAREAEEAKKPAPRAPSKSRSRSRSAASSSSSGSGSSGSDRGRKKSSSSKGKSKDKKRGKEAKKGRRSSSGSGSGSDSDSDSGSDRKRGDKGKAKVDKATRRRLKEEARARKLEQKRQQKKMAKMAETPEQKLARRLQKAAAKAASTLGYTNEDNPFGDPNLTKQFVWGKKEQKEELLTGTSWLPLPGGEGQHGRRWSAGRNTLPIVARTRALAPSAYLSPAHPINHYAHTVLTLYL